MYLKLRKINPWLICLVASLCVSGGLFLYLTQNAAFNYYFDGIRIVERTTQAAAQEAWTSTAAEAESIGRAETIGVDEETTSKPKEETISNRDQNAEAETYYDPDQTGEENVDNPHETEGVNDENEYPSLSHVSIWMTYIGLVILCFGLICGFIFVFISKQETPILGPEIEVLLLTISGHTFAAQISQISVDLFTQLVIYFLAAAVFFISVRGLWWWYRSYLSMRWSFVYRLGYRVSRNMKNPEWGFPVMILWCAVTAVCGSLLIFQRWKMIYGIELIGISLFGMLAMWKYGIELKSLLQEFDHLLIGEPISVHSTVFEEKEENLRSLQKKHEEAIQTAVTSERFKVELISNVSHDLRTPLTSILGYGELLRQEELSEKGREYLTKLNQKAGYMRDLVESLFELTKVSSGALETKREQIDLIKLLEQTIGMADDQLIAASLQVRRHYETKELPIITDGARMHQVFSNLLGNAIKYALPGTRIHLEVKQMEEYCRVRMTNVASYEMDFDPEEILQRFARGDKARSTSGSGLGLAIAQTYTESVGGNFRVSIEGDQFSAIVE